MIQQDEIFLKQQFKPFWIGFLGIQDHLQQLQKEARHNENNSKKVQLQQLREEQ
ncbi:unnamed protein product [Paramecium sonneborni]|uniref:Uncharacterized protein n=1 Tax=Paramecium sonneborni TaxID=65129 RepID=A0A8S1RS76_9CILI|nr:unnamed protein product [Paramecium sonneborni]